MSTIRMDKRNERGQKTTGINTFFVDGVKHTIEVKEDHLHVHNAFTYRRKKARAFVWSNVADTDHSVLETAAKILGLKDTYTIKSKYPVMDELWKIHNLQEEILMHLLLE